ncbi:uncharacterized protein LAJ45_10262 [Morchella importuna]|uniref:uncharacterized protein n=1 Tax=Morchella importuna TaxID=1174673 RepID=UPI001E8E2F33|nr:uncharacterized protein LAJ45_10262 [Morchella importuna]KAH8145785.1 hypothetical protein LAJ45_10262 [Morchella importuna]
MLRTAAVRASFRAVRPQNVSRSCFSTTAAPAALSPYSRSGGLPRNKTTDISRNQSTTAAAVNRPVPSPSFNQDPPSASQPAAHDLHPLQPRQAPEMDDSFVGMSGGEIFHEMMLRHDVKHIFGYAGGAILPVFDAIYNSPHFDFIMPRHEQGAGHMAEGYARASGKPGVVLVTSGPGATNVITPIQDALSDGTPLVVFCGQVPTSAIGTDAFQEADVIGISRACTKWNVMVKNVAELPRRINEAFEIATSGRPGPVLVDLPKDVTAGILRKAIPVHSDLPAHPSAASIAAKEASKRRLDASIQRVARLVNMAKKPIIYAGAGIIERPEGPEILAAFAEKAKIPVTTTLQGLGGFDELDPKSLHMLGMHGSPYANLSMQEADLIIALGARFDDRVTGNVAKFAPNAKIAASEGRGGIVHFEILPKNINKVVQATEAVEGDVANNLSLLIPHVESVVDRPEWFTQINDWKKRFPFAYEKESPGSMIKPQSVIEELSRQTAALDKKTIIATGVGQHQMWAAQHFRWRSPRTMVTSGGLGTMGFGLPAAIGAKVACPEAIVVDIDGDASFSMTLSELSTAVQFNVGVKIIILNNEEQGMVTQWQSLFYEDRYSWTHQKNPDFVKLADAMGLKGMRATKIEEIPGAIKELLEYDGPVLLEVVVDKKVPVLPMVPAGKALHEFLAYDPDKDKMRKAALKARYPDGVFTTHERQTKY